MKRESDVIKQYHERRNYQKERKRKDNMITNVILKMKHR